MSFMSNASGRKALRQMGLRFQVITFFTYEAHMTTTQDQDCPLCQTPAKFKFVDAGNRKHFICPLCTDFQISIGAETRLSSSIQEWRTQYSEMARSGNDEKILVIRLPPGGQRQEGVAITALTGDLVFRAKSPQ
jgi:hypothetical protein